MKYYIIAGEPSGDLHGSNLIKALHQVDAEAEVRAWGGDLMERAGAELAMHYRELAIMGIWQVLVHLPKIFRNLAYCKRDIEAFKPDVVIFIDYSGFNLRIAKWTHQQGLRSFYYISPQVWATRASRVHKIKQFIDQMFVILPFEAEFYKKYDYPVHYVGHPLLDVVQHYTPNPKFREEEGLGDKPLIALLPGSRRQEIKKMLSVMLSVAGDFPGYQFVVAAAPSIPQAFYASFLEGYDNVKVVRDKTYDLLYEAEAALVTSGTATLETALFKVPQVVCYKTDKLLYWVAKRIIKVPYISLVNIIMQRELVKELIQDALNPVQLKQALTQILDPTHRTELQEAYSLLHQQLGSGGASLRAAKQMQKALQYPVRNSDLNH